MAGANQLYQLKLFLACSIDDDYTSDYRKSFPALSKNMKRLQFQGTEVGYVPSWPPLRTDSTFNFQTCAEAFVWSPFRHAGPVIAIL